MIIIEWLLSIFLILCAIAVSISENLLNSVIIFMSYSLAMTVIFIFLRSPDSAIIEAAAGAGITGILFFLALRRIGQIEHEKHDGEKKNDGN